MPPDEIDLNILRLLQEKARISNVDLADAVGLSPAPCLRRVRELERTGIIRRHVALLEPSAVNLRVAVFVQISLDRQVEGHLDIFEQAILQRPEVLECYLMTGDADYLVRVVVSDVAAYEQFLRDHLTRIEVVAGIKSSFALKQVKYLTALPLSYVSAASAAQAVRTTQSHTGVKWQNNKLKSRLGGRGKRHRGGSRHDPSGNVRRRP